MFDADAIKTLTETVSIKAARESVNEAIGNNGAAALPSHFAITDLEKFQPTRRRARGNMKTSVAADFAEYVEAHKENGASIFINPENMAATAVLNFGMPDAPGHADNTAVFEMKRTAAYTELRRVAAPGMKLSQTDIAEFIEDWAQQISCSNGEGDILTAKAVAAVRNITIEVLSKRANEEKRLGTTRSALESVQATSPDMIPETILFTCHPYKDLQPRTFAMRLSILTGDKPSIILRIIKIEQHEEDMAIEFAEIIKAAINNKDIPIMLGAYTAK